MHLGLFTFAFTSLETYHVRNAITDVETIFFDFIKVEYSLHYDLFFVLNIQGATNLKITRSNILKTKETLKQSATHTKYKKLSA